MFTHFLTKMKILFTARKYQENIVLRVRVTINRKKSSDVSTDIFFKDSDCWNAKKQTFENSDYLNERMRREKIKIENIFLKMKNPTAKGVIDIYTGKSTLLDQRKNVADELSKHLEEADMVKIETFAFDQKLQPWADIYIILQHTAMNYSDYKAMDFRTAVKTNKEGNEYIEFYRNKTNQKSIVPVSPKLKEILEKYKYSPPKRSRSHLNKKLKEIAKLVGIADSRFSVKFGRKTFANLLLEKGVSLDVTSKVLGHANTNLVQKHYAELKAKRIVNEIGEILKW